MNAFEWVEGYFSEDDKNELSAFERQAVTEIRIRCGFPVKYLWPGGSKEMTKPYTPERLTALLSRMLGHSLYAWEDELGQGFFTLPMGCRVGVTGRFSGDKENRRLVRAQSMLIRMAREIKGCAQGITDMLTKGNGIESAVILSPPGLGKTTYLRDAARIFSQNGYSVSVVDERGEIACVMEGRAMMDMGKGWDVCEGVNKADGVLSLIRSMAPDVIVLDEIGSKEDAQAVREAARMGAGVIASAHAGSMEDALKRPMLSALLNLGAFRHAFVLHPPLGSEAEVYAFREGKWQSGSR